MVENLTLGHGNCGGLPRRIGSCCGAESAGRGATPSREHRQPHEAQGGPSAIRPGAVRHAVTDLTPGLRSGIRANRDSTAVAAPRHGCPRNTFARSAPCRQAVATTAAPAPDCSAPRRWTDRVRCEVLMASKCWDGNPPWLVLTVSSARSNGMPSVRARS